MQHLGASHCTKNTDCNAFTIFFERHPTLDPGPTCSNPPSTTLIKCDLWAGTILRDISLNYGETRENFEGVIAGSNAVSFIHNSNTSTRLTKNQYVQDVIDNVPTAPGYSVETYANGAAIEAPLDCNGQDTYLGSAGWHDGQFHVARCTETCEEVSANSGEGRKCRFVNTYLLRRDGVPYSQQCAMYTAHWPTQ